MSSTMRGGGEGVRGRGDLMSATLKVDPYHMANEVVCPNSKVGYRYRDHLRMFPDIQPHMPCFAKILQPSRHQPRSRSLELVLYSEH